jgi:hypothetical protein
MAQTYQRRIDRLNRKDRKRKEFAESTEVVLVKGFFNSPIHCRKHFEYGAEPRPTSCRWNPLSSNARNSKGARSRCMWPFFENSVFLAPGPWWLHSYSRRS